MDPQEEVAAFLRSKGVQRAVINDMLRSFAHDLAEAIRAYEITPSGDPTYDDGKDAGLDIAADLIDPDVAS